MPFMPLQILFESEPDAIVYPPYQYYFPLIQMPVCTNTVPLSQMPACTNTICL